MCYEETYKFTYPMRRFRLCRKWSFSKDAEMLGGSFGFAGK